MATAFDSDSEALRVLSGGRFHLSRGGIISPNPGVKPTQVELDAAHYLCTEWDYGYHDGVTR